MLSKKPSLGLAAILVLGLTTATFGQVPPLPAGLSYNIASYDFGSDPGKVSINTAPWDINQDAYGGTTEELQLNGTRLTSGGAGGAQFRPVLAPAQIPHLCRVAPH